MLPCLLHIPIIGRSDFKILPTYASKSSQYTPTIHSEDARRNRWCWATPQNRQIYLFLQITTGDSKEILEAGNAWTKMYRSVPLPMVRFASGNVFSGTGNGKSSCSIF